MWSGRDGDDDLAADRATTEELARSGDSAGSGDVAADVDEGDGSSSESGAGGGSDTGGKPSAAPTTSESPDLVDLGSFADAEALRAALATGLPPGETTLSPRDLPSDEEVARCDTQLRHVFELTDGPTGTAVATIGTELVLVLEYERVSFQDEATPTTFVSVVDPATCTPELSFERRPG